MADNYGSGYGKRPLWQWVAIYLVLGAIVYGLIYYFYLGKKGSSYSLPGSSMQKNSAPAY